jgi:5-formyltetrahydrofolate cyclo-ligase
VTAQAGSISNSRADRRSLRQRIRAERRALPPGVRAAADRAIANHIRRLGAYRTARRIAVFLAFDGEPSLAALMESAARSGKRLYAPVITRSRMRFAELELGGQFGTNFFGIQEPHLGAPIDPRRLDLVLTPLVAFDDWGVRIGVGRGYYDRCFRFLRGHSAWKRPKLLAVAYELQHVPAIEENDWDVPLWGAVTEARVRRFDRETRTEKAV